MFEERKFIGEYLCDKGIITREQLRKAIAEHKKSNQRIGDILIKNGWASEEDLAKALSEQLGFAFIDVATYQVDPIEVKKIPENMARRLLAIPIYKIANSLTVAMVDPLNLGAIDELEKITNLNVNPVFATRSAVEEAINKYFGSEKKGQEPQEIEEETIVQTVKGRPPDEIPKLIEEATQAPVINLVNKLIGDAVKMGASDIHLEPQEGEFYYRYRVDGILQKFKTIPKENQSAVLSRVKIMANVDITERRLPQDGRTQISIDGVDVDLRIATFPTIYGEHVAIRILDKSTGVLKLEEIGLKGELLKDFKDVIQRPHGIVLVTGPTGSGKSTSLYSVLNTIRDSKKNIITLEDPVEYSINEIHQSQVNVKAGLTFATGLRSIVRLDPDIIMIGEIRDKETAEIAVHAALTGHLVFSTLHTNDSISSVTRLIDIGVEPYLISSSVTAVLAQRLVRRLCDKCKTKYQPSDTELTAFGAAAKQLKGKKQFFNSKGCKECLDTGFKGRVGIFELFIPTEEIRQLITQKASSHELWKAAKESHMRTLLEDGLEKAQTGVTSLSEILRVIQDV